MVMLTAEVSSEKSLYPDVELMALLTRLAERPGMQVHIVSGRSRECRASWFGALPIGLHTEHGFASRLEPGRE